MEFMKMDINGGKVLGKYQYMFSSESAENTVLEPPATLDPASGRWFSESGEAFQELQEYANADFRMFMAEYDCVYDNPSANLRKTQYYWRYQDEAQENADIFYEFTEYRSKLYRTIHFSIRNVSEDQFQKIQESLMVWHRSGEFMLDGIRFEVGGWKESSWFDEPEEYEDPPYIGSLVDKRVPMDLETVRRALEAWPSIQDGFVSSIAEPIHTIYTELLAQNPQNTDIARELYEKVIDSPNIKPLTWLHKILEWVITEPIPFA